MACHIAWPHECAGESALSAIPNHPSNENNQAPFHQWQSPWDDWRVQLILLPVVLLNSHNLGARRPRQTDGHALRRVLAHGENLPN